MAKFTDAAKTQLADELIAETKQAVEIANYNKGWDIGFRVGLLLLGLTTVVCSGIATSDLFTNPKPWSLVSTILAGVSSALSAFALAEFGFSKRQRVWEKKSNLLRSMRDELRFSDPDEEAFRKRLERVRELNDLSDPLAEV